MSEKLQKVLARLGYASRREIERWISDGRIEVNGELATVGDRVADRDEIHIDGKLVKASRRDIESRVIVYHKPVGEICSREDREGKGTVYSNLPFIKPGRWISIGRLDVNTSGLLLFTNDGDLANKLMHPSTEIKREYACRVLGEANVETLKRLTQGVALEDGQARFEHIVPADSSGINHWYYVVVGEGRNRLVRRLWESQNLIVNRLKRVRYGNIILGSMPKVGCWRDLDRKEKNWVESLGADADADADADAAG